jgi:hypothetical protein
MSLQEPDWDALLSLHPEFVETVARHVLQWTATIDDAPQHQGEDLLTVAEVATRLSGSSWNFGDGPHGLTVTR